MEFFTSVQKIWNYRYLYQKYVLYDRYFSKWNIRKQWIIFVDKRTIDLKGKITYNLYVSELSLTTLPRRPLKVYIFLKYLKTELEKKIK